MRKVRWPGGINGIAPDEHRCVMTKYYNTHSRTERAYSTIRNNANYFAAIEIWNIYTRGYYSVSDTLTMNVKNREILYLV